MNLVIRNVSKEFYTFRRGRVIALRNVNLEINRGEFFVILGPSGCGKSTLLNILAGLEKPSTGEIWLGARLTTSAEKKICLTPKERNVAMVFQSYALYPHMSVFKNIAFPLQMAKVSKHKIEESVRKVAKMLDIESLLLAKPNELSGGQMQRVAIARALVRHPFLFLLDEPLSNLDAQLRLKMREELKNLQCKINITTVYVTHDQVEAITLGDRIAILKDGEVQQVGEPLKVYAEPINTFVAQFLGTPPMNLIKAEICEDQGDFFVKLNNIKIKLDSDKSKTLRKLNLKTVIIGFRPEDIEVVQNNSKVAFWGNIMFLDRLGPEVIVHFDIEGNRVLVKLAQDRGLKEGERVKLSIKTEKMHLFDERGRKIAK